MIQGYCRTNLDDWQRYSWPTRFVAVPRIGEMVRALDGHTLKVVRVTHLITNTNAGTPMIEVELNKVT